MQLLGELAAIWRYPTKSLAAQPLMQTAVDAGGIPGDRAAALFVRSGHAREGKTYRGKENNLLHTTGDAEQAARFAEDRGVALEVRAENGAHYFDDAPVSLIFDVWIAQVERALGTQLDPLRWRPNFYARATGDFHFEEPDLIGAAIEIGDARLVVRGTIGRCVTPNYDVRTGVPNDAVLRYVAQQRDNVMGVYCEVELAGTVRAGDALRLRAR